MGHLPWRRLLVLVLASGAFSYLAMPSSAVRIPDAKEALSKLGIEVQRPAAAEVRAAPEPPLEPTPQGTCGPGSRPETDLQGRVTPDDHSSGRAAQGFTCNTEMVGQFTKPTTVLNDVPGVDEAIGSVGGFKVLRYVDGAGNECAYYDTTLLFPTNIFDGLTGVNVLEMSDPSEPLLHTRLVTPAMQSPHESLILSEKRGLLMAVTGNPAFLPGVLDIYDISEDCRRPVLRSSSPTAILGHESGISPDGNTLYSGSTGANTLVAVDISNPGAPVPLAAGAYSSHGLNISNDGNRAYVATTTGALGGQNGLTILDTSEVQSRTPSPQLREVARLQWTGISIPQNAIPVTIKGHRYLVEIDEFGTLDQVGAGRIIDISDETNPRVVSNLRLEVHQPENFDEIDGDVGAANTLGGYSGHYCNVPKRADPGIVACSMPLSGLRIFDIRDPINPREIAYFNAPVLPKTFPGGPSGTPPGASNWAMSSPAFAPERGEIWYSDGYSGFYAVRVTNGVWPFRSVRRKDCSTPRRGTRRRDLLAGTALGDLIRGRRGNDRIRGGAGNDCLYGNRGKDKLKGGSGNDRLNGGKGRDKVKGGAGRDRLRGGNGTDKLKARDGSRDRVNCGTGQNDVAIVDKADRVSRRCETVRRRR